jgi:hypothetical protein
METKMNDDWLLRYCIALDAGNFDALGEVIEQAKSVPGLYESIEAMHRRFDSNESWTQQLQAYRKPLLSQDK